MGMSFQFPAPIGGDEDYHSIEHGALLSAMEPAFDTSSGTELWCETYGDATAIGIAWACGQRLANQAVPSRMLDALETQEECAGLRPTFDDHDIDRRNRLGAKLRSIAGNSLNDLEQACETALGLNFEEVRVVDHDDQITYWPGINPGPPGLEWCSNRLRYGVVMNTDALSTNRARTAKLESVAVQMETSLPAWASYCVGVGSDFIAGIGIVGETFL